MTTEPVPVIVPPSPPAGSFGKGILAAIVATLIGAVVWAFITVATDRKIGLVAVAIGYLVGLAIERFGGGDRRLPVAGAVIAVIGCVLGYIFADAHIIGKARDVSIFNELFQHPHEVWTYYTDGFAAFDAVFYAIAAYEGFYFGRRGVQRAQAAAAAHHPASIEVPGPPGAGPGLGYGIDPSAPLGSAAETSPTTNAPGEPPAAP